MAAAFIKPMTSFVTKLARDPRVQDAAIETGSAAAGALLKRTLARPEQGGPSARAQAHASKNMSMAPRNGNLPRPAAHGPVDEAWIQAALDRAQKKGPGVGVAYMPAARRAYIPARPEAVNPDALPYLRDDGSWLKADDARNPANARFARTHQPAEPERPIPDVEPPTYEQTTENDVPPAYGEHDDPKHSSGPLPVEGRPAAWPQTGAPAAHAKPHAQAAIRANTFDAIQASMQPAAPTRPGRRERLQQSFRETLGNFFGASRSAAPPKGLPDPVTVAVRAGDGPGIDLQLSRSEVRAYQQARGIDDRQFDLRDYLQYEQRRHDPLQPGKVKVSGGDMKSVADLGDIEALEINSLDSRRRILGT